MPLTLIFKDNSHPRRAVLRTPATARDNPGGIVESVICDPGMSFGEAERGLLEAAEQHGIKADDNSIKIASTHKPPPAPKLVSYPGGTVKVHRD